MADSNTWAKIETRKTELGDLYIQMDNIRNRLKGEKFFLTDYNKKTKLDDVINVTENKSKNYVTMTRNTLLSYKWQTVVNSVKNGITSREAHKIEQFIEDSAQQADEYVQTKFGLPDVNTFLCNHIVHTGVIGIHWLSSIKDGKHHVHCVPLDMRWTPMVVNSWIAPIFFKSRDDLEMELENYQKGLLEENKSNFVKPNGLQLKNNDLRDYWDEKKHELWINGQKVYEEANAFGEIPHIVVFPGTGFMFRDESWIQYESPSLLSINMDLYDEISRILSVDATLGFESLYPAHEYETDNPVQDELSRPIPRRGESLAVPKGERHVPVPRSDINMAAQTSREDINRMVDDAAPIAPKSYNTPPAAVTIASEVELMLQTLNPLVKGLEILKAQRNKLMIRQCIYCLKLEGVGEIEVGGEGRKNVYTLDDLKDPDRYFITVKMMAQNKRMKIVNEARAQAMIGWAPMKYILEDVLEVEDVAGWMREMRIESAKKADPALQFIDMAVSLCEEAQDTEDKVYSSVLKFQSKAMLSQAIRIIKLRLQPAPLPEEANMPIPEQPKGNAQTLVPMLGRGQG